MSILRKSSAKGTSMTLGMKMAKFLSKKVEKPTVYYGGLEGNPLNQLLTTEGLYPSLKKKLGEDQPIFGCPVSNSVLANMRVIYAPFDMLIRKQQGNYIVYNMTNGRQEEESDSVSGPGDSYAQFLAGFVYFVADSEVKVRLYPPFLHPGGITCGVIGEFDISKWFRGISFAQWMGDEKEYKIKNGEPIAYFEFDRPVKLKRITFPQRCLVISGECIGIKNVVPKMSMKRLYSRFESSNRLQAIIKAVKDYNDV